MDVKNLIVSELKRAENHTMETGKLEKELPEQARGMVFRDTLNELFFDRKIKYVSPPTKEPISLGAEAVQVALSWIELVEE